jgi:hypothetical protein
MWCAAVLALPVALSGAAPPVMSIDAAMEIFQAAGVAYEKGDFDGAASQYQLLVHAGLGDATVHYNLGNALYRLGRTGESILAFERARFLDPADTEIRDNLEFVSSQIVDRVESPGADQGPFATLWAWHGRIPPNGATGIFLAAWWLFNLCLAAALFGGNRRLRHLGAYALSGGLLAVVLTGSVMGLLVYRRDAVVEGIIRTARVDLQSTPGGGVTLSTVHEGLKVRIRGARGEWLEVTLPNGFRGWVPGEAVGVI